MVNMRQDQSLSMLWCIECHLAPEKAVGEKHLITAMDPEMRKGDAAKGLELVEKYHIKTRLDCSACHR